jgi:hypothetical protein
MKLAICISGNLNDWESKYYDWLNFFYKLTALLNENATFDIFVHTWDFNIISDKSTKNLQNHEILNFKNFLSPKLIQIDNSEKYFSRQSQLDSFRKKFINNKSINCLASEFAPQLYSMMMSAHLKRIFELDNDFEYDVCIGMTTNMKIDETNLNILSDVFCVPENKTMYVSAAIKTFDFPYDKIDHNLYYADSHTFDVISSIYNMLPILNEEQFNPNTNVDLIFGFFLRMFDIKIKRLNILYKQKSILYDRYI